MNRKRSEIWNCFSVVNEHFAKCNFCSGSFSYKGGSTANLSRHLKRKHPTTVVALSERGTTEGATDVETYLMEPSTSTPGNVSTSKSVESTVVSASGSKQRNTFQTTLVNFTKRPLPLQTTRQLDEQLIIMIAAEYQTLSIVEDKEFRKFVLMLNPNYALPSRKTVSNVLLPQLYTKLSGTVKQLLSTAEHLSVTSDGWTSINNQSFQSLTVHFINDKNELTSLLLGCCHSEERHTAEMLSTNIRQELTKWEVSQKVCAAVTDNAANITAAIRILNWRHIPCFAHSLNLIVQKGLHEINESRNKAKSVVEFFKRSPTAMAKLENLQKQMDIPILKLKQDIITRWNSTFEMLDRIIKIKEPLLSAIAVTNCNANLTLEDFKIFSWCCNILKPFKDITEELSSEKGVTISKVILFSRILINKISKIKSTWDNENPPEVYNLCEVLLNELQKRFQDVEDNVVCSEATFLDPRFKKHGFRKDSAYTNTHKRILQKTCALISKKRTETNANESKVEEIPTPNDEDIWSDFDVEVIKIKFLSEFYSKLFFNL